MTKNKNGVGNWVIIALCAITVLLWFIKPTKFSPFADTNTTLISFGQLTGLVGMTLFSLNFVLSTRLPAINKLFRSLNKAYISHSKIGQIALMLLLVHPLLLIPKYAIDLHGAAVFLLPGDDLANDYGFYALALILVLIILTLYLKPKYNIWKITHKFMGVALLLGLLHIWFIPSDLTTFAPLRYYMLTLTIVGILAAFYKTVLGDLVIKKYKYTVTAVTKLSIDVTEITLEPESEKLNFTEGQFVFVSFTDNNLTTEQHPFSISSAATQQELTLTVKNLGDYTTKLGLLKPGAKAAIEGPYGEFCYSHIPNQQQIWIAGGIGITPFIGMARTLTSNYHIDLYYCFKTQEDAVYLDELTRIWQTLGQSFNLISVCSEQSPRLTAEFVLKNTSNAENRAILLCSPSGMNKDLTKQFVTQGVDRRNIYFEEFGL